MELMPHTLVLAGGFGTRLRPLVSDRPKILADISGKPFIEYQLDWLIEQGVTHVTLAVHYLADQIIRFVDQWSDNRLILNYIYEEEPLGTGGAVVNFIHKSTIDEKLLVINGDTLFQFSLSPAISFMRNKSKPALLIAAQQEDVARFGTITIQDNFVKSFNQATGMHHSGLVNGGVYLMDSSIFLDRKISKFSLENDLFPNLASEDELLAYVVDESEGFFDIGTPDAYKNICTGNSFVN